MKVQTKSRPPRKILVILLILGVVLALGYTATAYVTKSLWPFAEHPKTTNDQQPQNNTQDTDTTESETPPAPEPTPENPTKTPSQFDGTDPNTNSNLTVLINYLGVTNSNLTVRTTIDQYISSGSCTLTLSRAGAASITRQADIVANPSSATCKGFDIPTTELSSGNWTVTITVTGGDKSGSVSDEVTL